MHVNIPMFVDKVQRLSFTIKDVRNLSTNLCYGVCGNRVIKNRKAKEWTLEIQEKLRDVIPTTWDVVPCPEPVILHITFRWKKNRASDLDNIKPLIDALQGFIYENDKQIMELKLEKKLNCGFDAIDIYCETKRKMLAILPATITKNEDEDEDEYVSKR